jgi:hypothetical protein
MSDFSVTMSPRSQALLRYLSSGKASKAIESAAKRAGASATRKVKAEVSRQIRARKAVMVRQVHDGIAVTSSGTGAETSWRVRVKGGAMQIGKLKHKQTKSGVKFQESKGVWSELKGAFVATMKTGHSGVFYRAKSTHRKKYKNKHGKRQTSELGIREQSTANMGTVFQDTSAVNAVLSAGEVEFVSTYLRLMKSAL